MTDDRSHMTSNWVLFHGLGGEEIVIQRYAVVAVLPALNTYMPYTVIVSDGGTRWIVREHLTEVTSALGITPGETPTNYDKVYREAFERQAQQIAEQMRTINENDLKVEELQEELAATRIASSAKDDRIKALVAQLDSTTNALKKTLDELDRTKRERDNALAYQRTGNAVCNDPRLYWYTTYGDYAKWPGTKD